MSLCGRDWVLSTALRKLLCLFAFSCVPAIAEVARVRAADDAPSAIQPRQVVWLKVRATAYLMHDEIDKAVADLSVAIQAAPDDAELYQIRGLAVL